MPTAVNKENSSETESTEVVKQPKKVVEKVVLSWSAPARPFKRRNKEFYVTVVAIAGLLGLVLFLVEGFMPVILLVSLVFLFYVMNTVEPEKIEYKVTNLGIKIGESVATPWEVLTRFWISRRFDSELLVIEMVTIPGRLELVLDPKSKEEVKKAVSGFIPEEEIPASNLDRAANWFSKKMPGSQ